MNLFSKTFIAAALGALLSLPYVPQPARAQTATTNFGGNLLTNPWMEIDQANEGTAVTVTSTAAATFTYGGGGSAAAFTLGTFDGWGSTMATPTASNTIKMQNAALAPNGSASDVLFTLVTGSATRTDGILITLEQRVEPMRIAPLQYGTANAQTSYLSFCAKASIAGNYSFYIAGGTAARTSDIAAGTSGSAYFHQFNIPTAAQWSCYQFPIPGDTGGTWLATTTTVDATHGATLGFVLDLFGSTGSKQYGVPSATQADGVWQNVTNTGTLAQVIGSNVSNVLMGKTTGATFELTGVKWSLDQNPLTHNPELELLQAQRYYTKTFAAGVGGVAGVASPRTSIGTYVGSLCAMSGSVTAAAAQGVLWSYPVNMRAAPTIITYNPKATAATWANFSQADAAMAVTVDPATQSSTRAVFIKNTGAPTAVGDVICIGASADARL